MSRFAGTARAVGLAGRMVLAAAACWCAAGLGGSALAGQLDNGRLVVAGPSWGALVVETKGAGGKPTRLELRLCGSGDGAAAVDKAEAKGAGALRIAGGGVEADLTLEKKQLFLTVTPAKPGGWLEVRVRSRYAVLPDFFGYDVVYDPLRFKSDGFLVPAENFLLNFVEGNRAIVMCTWPGSLANAKGGEGQPAAAKPEGRDPAVRLALDGQGGERRVAAARIELLGGPVNVAVLEHDNLWFDQDVAAFKALTPTKLEWKRPFDAHWRLDTLVAEGKKSKDNISRSQSYRFLYPPKDRFKPGENADIEDVRASVDQAKIWDKDGVPRVYEERTYGHIYQAWFSGQDTNIALPADDPFRAQREKGGMDKVENVYDRILVYPLDRDKSAPQETPVDVYTFVDIMRETLGQEPCAYVLDLEGVRGRGAGGGTKIVDDATCSIWGGHIAKLIGKKELTAEERQYLVRSLKDLTVFLHAVNDRIGEYSAFNDSMAKFAGEAKAGKAGAAAARIEEISAAMTAALAKYNLAEFKKLLDGYDKAIAEEVAKVEAGDHSGVKRLARLKDLGQSQDNAVSDCRRYVKAMRHEVSFVESVDPEAQKFVLAVRDMSQKMLRNPHPKELLHSDPNNPRMGLPREQREKW